MSDNGDDENKTQSNITDTSYNTEKLDESNIANSDNNHKHTEAATKFTVENESKTDAAETNNTKYDIKKETAKRNSMDEKKTSDISEVLHKFGRYQTFQYLLLFLPSLFVTMININFVFVAGDIDYRCKIPECESPESTSAIPNWWPNITVDRCSRPVLNEGFIAGDSICTNNSFSHVLGECTEWIYESNNTIVAELYLACQPWKMNLVGTIHNVGMLFSMILAGWISDRFGRKPAIIICAVASCVGHLKTLATSYYFYGVIEFIESLVTGGIYPATTVLMMEIAGKSNRILAGVVFAYIVYFGELIFACIAMIVPHWKTLVRIINSPSIIFLSYIFLLRESPRWQILNNKTDEAKKTIEIAANINNIVINPDDLKYIDSDKLKEKFEIENCNKKEGFKDIFTSKEILKRLLVASVCRFSTGFIYYGLMINSVLLPGDKYTNFLLSTVMCFPGELIALYLMNAVGRKLPLVIGYILSALTCVASAHVETTWIKITLFLIGKMIISACYTGIITFSIELYPTSTRSTLMGLGGIMSRCGAMLAPLTPMLLPISPALPSVIFGCLGFTSGILLTLTPETKELPLMDTIKQIGAHCKKNKDSTRSVP